MDVAPAPRWRMLLVLAFAFFAYWLVLFIGTHVPVAPTPHGDPYSLDKLMHATAFGVLAVLACAAGAAWIGPSWKLYAAVFAAIAIYGLVDEVSQGWVQNRKADLRDWLADVFGAVVGIGLFVIARRFTTGRATVRR